MNFWVFLYQGPCYSWEIEVAKDRVPFCKWLRVHLEGLTFTVICFFGVSIYGAMGIWSRDTKLGWLPKELSAARHVV